MPAARFVCGCCGWIACDIPPQCPHCQARGAFRQRGGEPEREFWERRFRGHGDDQRFLVFALSGVAVFGVGVLAGGRLALLGVAPSPAWWAFLALVSSGCGALAAVLAHRASRFELVLSQEGVELFRGRNRTDALAWDEIRGLEFVASRHSRSAPPVYLVIRGPHQPIILSSALQGWNDALTLLRQHAPVEPPPIAGWRHDQAKP